MYTDHTTCGTRPKKRGLPICNHSMSPPRKKHPPGGGKLSFLLSVLRSLFEVTLIEMATQISAGLLQLPTEVLQQIISYLPVRDLSKRGDDV
ncbi:hypothetical protein EYZ11_013399 [Aspergillus tanneri]|uniref:F-box domain-containing protein n=1 Tax=Aspergillus tanneri TaxID=1220188 RepID=A0A4S3IY08_9EURO|nr:hypothetical protein EYZ11_013399 [Aspergillus tanneri]